MIRKSMLSIWLLPILITLAGVSWADVSGTVLTREGRPAVGVTVSWVDVNHRPVDRRDSVVTDAKGQFSFPAADLLFRQSEKPVLLAEQPEIGPAGAYVRYPNQRITIIIAQPLVELQITLRDTGGRPVTGLPVQLTGMMIDIERSYQAIPLPAELPILRTDDNGSVMLPDIPMGAIIEMTDVDKKFTAIRVSNIPHFPPARTRYAATPITLYPAGTISGRVYYADTQQPAVGIGVSVQGRIGRTLTDKEGRYAITQLPPGKYDVILDIDEERAKQWSAPAHDSVPVSANENVENIDFPLKHGALISGRVTTADTGKPVVGILVLTINPADRYRTWRQVVRTDAEGRYTLSAPAGELQLLIGGLPPEFIRPANAVSSLIVKDGENRTIDYTLPRSSIQPIHGQVVGPDGKPVPAAEVYIMPNQDGAWPVCITADDKGKFTFDPLPVTLLARSGEMATLEATPLTAGGDVILRLSDHAIAGVSGLVVDREGKPLTGILVNSSILSGNKGGIGPEVYTDADGRYTLTGLWPNQHYRAMAAIPENYAEWLSSGEDSVDFTLQPGEMRELKNLVRDRNYYIAK